MENEINNNTGFLA